MRKTLFFIPMLFFCLLSFTASLKANVPAPPANQQLGINDTIFNNLTEDDCRACHDSATHPCSTANVDRHHLLYGQPLKQGKCSFNRNDCLSNAQCNPDICEINGTSCSADADCPDAGLGETCGEVCRGETAAPDLDADNDGANDTLYSCFSCHRQELVGEVITFIVERNCLACHIQVPGEGSVHHLTQTAQGPAPIGDPNKGDCTPCHGTIVDDIGDGHTIPTYAPSLVTPLPSGGDGEPLNIEGNGAGACDYCHSTGTGNPLIPGTDGLTGVQVYSNGELHHNTGVYLSETGASNQNTCNWCHFVQPLPPANYKIRRCEGCHGLDSLHNIAADSDTGCFYDPADPSCEVVIGGEAPGYSHVGNDSDCWGCHGFAQAYATGSGPSAPSISGSADLVMTTGSDTSLTLTGAGFTNLIDGRRWVADVRMTGSDGSAITLSPTSITAGSVTVSIPGSTPPGTYTLTAVKSNDGIVCAESNPVVICIKPCVAITEAIDNGDATLTITGSGFGEAPPAGAEAYINVAVNGQVVDVVSWTDTRIIASFPAFGASAEGDTVTVGALFCNDTAPIQFAAPISTTTIPGSTTTIPVSTTSSTTTTPSSTTTSVSVCIPDCDGNFDSDDDVDGTDASAFKRNFGRNHLNNPFTAAAACCGDFDCDGDADGSDAAVFKGDFGRNAILNPCQPCSLEACSY